jgi:hypothetical protein
MAKALNNGQKKESGGYQAVGFTGMLNDTSWNERADIYQENGNWIFENTVREQNDRKAVKFTSTFINDTAVQFSNPAHDFPTDVNYTIADINTLRAFIIGPGKNGRDTIPFNYVRVK